MIETGISYFANGWPHHFERDLEDIQTHGCTYIVHCFSENELILARKRTEQFFRMTRDAGMGCWADPWAVMGLFGGEQFSAFVPRNPEACQILSTGQRAPAACPSAAETRGAMKIWLDAAIDFGAATIFWDEPHLYIPDWDDLQFAPDDAWACRCPRCLDAYQQEFGEPMPNVLTPSVQKFRQNLIVDFLREMVAYAHQKGAKNAICLLPVDDEANESLPWDQVAALPGVDIFGTDPYWFIHDKDCVDYVTAQTRRTVEICQKNDLVPQIWVEGFGIPAGREAELELGLQTALKAGATNLAVWGMHGNAAWDGSSERPEIVWEMVGKAFREIRSKS